MAPHAELSDNERVELTARTLLRRYGVMFQRLLAREPGAPAWRDLLMAYRRLEARGEIRGGRFVSGMSGEQFALPEAVSQLRAIRRAGGQGRLIGIGAADPLNLTGIVTSGDRIATVARSRILYRDGVPVLALEGGEMKVVEPGAEAPTPEMVQALVRKQLTPALRARLALSGVPVGNTPPQATSPPALPAEGGEPGPAPRARGMTGPPGMDALHERLAAALEDRYRIERQPDGTLKLLGRGGTATVYLAHDLRHDRPVALKVVHQQLAESVGAERFLREIRFVARLSHPHILPLFDSGEAAGLLYYVMPYVAGESLRQRLETEGRLPVATAVRVAREVALALDYAHRHGVIHRDIKPENILFEDDQAVVADFGIATAMESAGSDRLTETGLAVGTPAYMSPEQAGGSAPSTAGATSTAWAACCTRCWAASHPSPDRRRSR